MAEIVNITTWAGSPGEEVTVSNTGWTRSSSSPFGTADTILDSGTTALDAVRGGTSGSASYAYLRTETPGSANQNVRIGLVTEGTPFNDSSIFALARVSSNNWIGAFYAPNSGGTVYLRYCIGGTITTPASVTSAGALSGTAKNLELRVSGSSPAISAEVWFDGSQVIAPQTITSASLNAAGAVGFWTRPLGGGTENQGIRMTTFYAEDDTGGDVTAPVLSSPTGTATGSTTATVGATTDEANGTQYAVVTTSATAPSAAQIKAGQDHTGSAAAWAGSITISATGANTHSATGLTASTAYYAHLIHTDAAANDSNIVTSAQFTTSAAAAYSLPADVGSYSLTGQEAYYALGRIALSGSYSLTGNDATLTHSVPGSYSLTANAGSYSLTGIEALFNYTQPNSYSLTADGGTYSTVGRRANLLGPGDSPSLGDGDMFVKLALLGYTGALNNMLLKYYQDNGATSNQLNQAEMEWLAAQGFSTGTINERRAAFFLSFGYVGAMNDQESQYWWNL